MPYGYVGTMRVKPGHRDEVAALLLRDVEALRAVGAQVYAVGVVADDPDLVHVTEVWDSKQAHDDSLQLASVKATIAEAMPMLTGEFASREVEVVGGLGVHG